MPGRDGLSKSELSRQARAARAYARGYWRDHAKQPERQGLRGTSDNRCRVNGHEPGTGRGC